MSSPELREARDFHQPQFSPADLQRILDETFIQHLDYHTTLGSTNDHAKSLATSAEEQFPLLVLSDMQTAGRGRGNNLWWSSRGALTFSVMLATESARLPTERWPQISLTVGLVVCEMLEALLSRGVPSTSVETLPAVQLKWPNDVYIEGRKICGILVEVPRVQPGRLLLGIGVNMNNTLADAPLELQNTATTFRDLTGRQMVLTEALVLLLQKLANRLQPDALWNAQVREDWKRRCLLTGKKITLDLEVQQTTGICRGIDEEGALLLDVEGTLQRYFAGVISQIGE